MQAPAFWYQPRPGFLAQLLAPAAIFVAREARKRAARPVEYRSDFPVICVGNAVVGGSGKTPIVRFLADHLARRGVPPMVLSRGHGGYWAGPLLVDPEQHSALQVGDEPLMLARAGIAVTVARDRASGGRFLANQDVPAQSVILMDDGAQNPGLAKDLVLLAIDARRGFGNGKVLPAGPLREPLDIALDRAHAAILVGDGDPPMGLTGFTTPVFRARLEPEIDVAAKPDWLNRPLVAFAGIADPNRLRDSLAALGADIALFHGFPDHHRYRPQDLALLRRHAGSGRQLVTTEKDWVRLPKDMRVITEVLPVRLCLSEPAAFTQWLSDRLMAIRDGQ